MRTFCLEFFEFRTIYEKEIVSYTKAYEMIDFTWLEINPANYPKVKDIVEQKITTDFKEPSEFGGCVYREIVKTNNIKLEEKR